ncbi:hypothetical protein HYG77_00015 [Rhodococcus sp. ZPP]|uniref:hypothetical protein n=1 Tax=Rhodococcus sp. ZPP TaxID=2749906 RepID=UPI001AD871BA|nr:hypothetical protein [Rhodococcus sp. ZPP]QTJ64175.1 hypothetical protein HYG77_00015 [Rhodococcus sp. ZPP]
MSARTVKVVNTTGLPSAGPAAPSAHPDSISVAARAASIAATVVARRRLPNPKSVVFTVES